MLKLGRIVCPVDFDDVSRAALEYAVDLAAIVNASVDVVHVHAPPIAPMEPAEMGIWRATNEEARPDLEAFVAPYRIAKVPLRTRVSSGVPKLLIVDLIARLEADLVVIGTHGRTGVSRWLHGSVAEEVIRHSPVPVLAVKLDQHGARTQIPIRTRPQASL